MDEIDKQLQFEELRTIFLDIKTGIDNLKQLLGSNLQITIPDNIAVDSKVILENKIDSLDISNLHILKEWIEDQTNQLRSVIKENKPETQRDIIVKNLKDIPKVESVTIKDWSDFNKFTKSVVNAIKENKSEVNITKQEIKLPTSAKEPISVRLSDGKSFYKAIAAMTSGLQIPRIQSTTTPAVYGVPVVNPDGSNIAGGSGGGGDGAIVDGVSSSIKATVKDLTNSNPLATQIMDANGDAITSFGGGVEYAAGDAVGVTTTGKALVFEDGGTYSTVTSGSPLPVVDSSTKLTDAQLRASDVGVTDTTTQGLLTDGTQKTQLVDNAGTITADILDLTNSNPLVTALVDANGDQITSFGGGVQYTEGDTDATITGTALMWEDAANTLTTVSSTKPLPVSATIDTTGLALDATLTDKSQFTKLTDGTDTALVTTAGELNVKQSDVTATGNLTATSQAVTATLDGHGSVTFQITGTFVGTVIPEVSVDGTNWTTAYCYRVADGTNIQVGSFTESNVNEIWFHNTGGCSKFRLRCSAYTSGTITPFIRGSQTAAQSHVEAYITNSTGMIVDATGSTVQISDGGGSITVDGTIDISGSTLGANSGVDIGDVTINNAAGASAVNIQDGGNSITVDGAVTVSGTATVSATDLDIRNLAPATDTVAIGDGTSTATVRNLASNDALNVAITDGSGNQITSFGGGTQYTEGDTDASITGTALMMEGAANALVAAPGTAADGLLVNLGANNDVTVTSTVAVTQSGTWDEVGINDSGNSITVDNPQLSVVGSGTEATAMRVTIATDSTGVLSVDDNGGSLTVDGTVTANLAAGTNNIGDVDVLTLPVAYNAGTTSATTVRTVEATAATSTLSNVAGSASSVTLIAANTARKKVVMYNDSTADCYVKYGSAATSSSFTWLMAAGSHIEETDYNGIITGIWGSATGNMRVTEIST